MLTAHTVAVGDVHEAVLVEDLTRTQIVQYAGASGDYNPLHSDQPFATGIAGYPGIFAHGMLTMGMTGRLLTELAGPEGLLAYGVRFKSQVWPGDTLTATATVAAVRAEADGTVVDLALSTLNQRGEEVLAGTATVRASTA
jgi:acyl dehydratase